MKTRNAVVLALALALVLVGAACAPEPSGGTAPPGELFYTPPSPLPAGTAGDVIWWRNSTYTAVPNVKAYQVLFRSNNALDHPIAVSGTVLIPSSPWFGFGVRPIVGIGPGTLGLGDQCAVSRSLNGGNDGTANAALQRGWAVAVADYEGLGTPGVHTYMVGQSQGRTVLDAVRAAIRLSGSGLSVQAAVGIAGYSQGGASAGWAGELAPTYAPELRVKGIVPGGTPSDLTRVAENVDGSIYFGLAVMAAPGFNAEYPELNLDGYLNDAGRAALAAGMDKCAADLTVAFAGKHIVDYTTSNPLQSPVWQARLQQNKLGSRSPAAPVLLIHASDDEIIPFDQVQALQAAYCARGVTSKLVTATGGHVGGAIGYADQVANFLADRFVGLPAPTSC